MAKRIPPAWPRKTQATMPPRSEPSQPRSTVPHHGIGSGPGTASRASAPTRPLARMTRMSAISISASYPRGVARHGDLGADLARRVDERARGDGAVPVAMPRDRDQPRRHAAVEVDHGQAAVVRVGAEPGHEGHADSGPDHALHGAVVVGAEDDPRLQPALL